jgi:mannose-6-phosphate isomerase-like protein (cupin superfamily)
MKNQPTDASTAAHYNWGNGCDGWRLTHDPGLSVIEERVPPGCGETTHYHREAFQFFYVLNGEATMELADGDVTIGPRQGLQIPPQTPHRLVNHSETDLVFLVISSPSTVGDRVEMPGRPLRVRQGSPMTYSNWLGGESSFQCFEFCSQVRAGLSLQRSSHKPRQNASEP